MEWKDIFVNGKSHSLLEVCVYDAQDEAEIQNGYTDVSCVEMGLDMLPYLRLFHHIELLVLTGGMATEEGMRQLYNQKDLGVLVLDYEETDSDEEGILLCRFPKLQYVLSRSNLNIHGDWENLGLKVEICNEYSRGKCVRRTIEDGVKLLRNGGTFFFSTEAQSPASVPIMEILRPIELRLNMAARQVPFSRNFAKIGIILICMSQQLISAGFGKERFRIFRASTEADIRIQVDYAAFCSGSREDQMALCISALKKAGEYLFQKDGMFQLERFREIISQ